MVNPSLFPLGRLRRWWLLSGLASAGSAGRDALTLKGQNVVIYDHPKSETTIVIAGSPEARADLRSWFNRRAATVPKGFTKEDLERDTHRPDPTPRSGFGI